MEVSYYHHLNEKIDGRIDCEQSGSMMNLSVENGGEVVEVQSRCEWVV